MLFLSLCGEIKMSVFKPGDVVMLKSGGPKMTVDQLDGAKVWCDWFDGSKKFSDLFPSTSLEQSKQAKPSRSEGLFYAVGWA
jgi:uncharacterized protein YodC (DUF2158 family)